MRRCVARLVGCGIALELFDRRVFVLVGINDESGLREVGGPLRGVF